MDWGNGREPYYATVYQEPRFGCSSNYLPGYELAPDSWGPGNSLEVQNWPARSARAREDIRWLESLGDPPRSGRTANGETATILGFDGFRSGVVIGDTFVVVEATAEKTQNVLGSLRPVGG